MNGIYGVFKKESYPRPGSYYKIIIVCGVKINNITKIDVVKYMLKEQIQSGK